MKRVVFFIVGLICWTASLSAQTDLYQKAKALLKEAHPEIVLENKLIALNVWQINDNDSRESNVAFEKVYNVYRVARLKGGLKGIVVVGINIDNMSPDATIVLTKDGVTKTIQFKQEELGQIGKLKNVVFNSDGVEVYKDLNAPEVFSSVQKLITR